MRLTLKDAKTGAVITFDTQEITDAYLYRSGVVYCVEVNHAETYFINRSDMQNIATILGADNAQGEAIQ